MQNGVAARVPSDLQQHGALIPRPKTPDGAKRGSSSALACFGGGKVPHLSLHPCVFAICFRCVSWPWRRPAVIPMRQCTFRYCRSA